VIPINILNNIKIFHFNSVNSGYPCVKKCFNNAFNELTGITEVIYM
jgi:hypothetical protein